MGFPQQRTAAELATYVDGKLEGQPHLILTGVAGLKEAQPGQISFLEHPRYRGLLASTQASVVLLAHNIEAPPGQTVIRVDHPPAAFGKAAEIFAPPPISWAPGIHPTAIVSPTATVHPTVSIQAFAIIEPGARLGPRTVVGAHSYVGHETQIGEDCLLYTHVTIRERCRIGNRIILHTGAVIGSDGFGYEFSNGSYRKIPQTGYVQIDDDVEIGSNTTIDRGRFGRTWIQRGTKIDNLVQIAHNVIIGENTAIAAQAGISGSTLIGNRVRIAGQVGIVGHISIGDESTLLAQSGINHDVAKGQVLFGYPAQEHKQAMKTHANLRRLPHLVERIRKLEKQLQGLQKAISPTSSLP